MAGSKLVELEGGDHLPWFGDTDRIVEEIAGFLSTLRDEEAEMHRVLATVMFTDIVGLTERVAALGDWAWGDVLRRHHEILRALIARHRGREIDTAGDALKGVPDRCHLYRVVPT